MLATLKSSWHRRHLTTEQFVFAIIFIEYLKLRLDFVFRISLKSSLLWVVDSDKLTHDIEREIAVLIEDICLDLQRAF